MGAGQMRRSMSFNTFTIQVPLLNRQVFPSLNKSAKGLHRTVSTDV
jgi:hypothetical protein